MSLLTLIDQVPLYDTIREAKIWAKQYNLQGYHTHYFNGIKGYMGGDNHQEITTALQNGIQTSLDAIDQTIGVFAVTDEEINYYQQSAASSQSQNLTPPPTSTPQPQVPTAPPSQVPSYTPPSTGGGSSSGGGY
jgi:hypothetical protein